MKKAIFVILSLLLSEAGFTQKTTIIDFGPFFEKYGVDGCFVLYDETVNEYTRYHPALCDSGYIPASTFKIPHSVIALEEGIIRDTSQLIPWNGHEWPNAAWNHEQTLKTAVKYSCVWVYTDFAEKIGINKYYSYVNAFNYGNRDLTGPPTMFWLAGLFRISANQQIEFLRRFYHYQLPVSKRSIDLVKGIIILEQTNSYWLSGKTGGGVMPESDYIMWFVGYLERNDHTYFFAMNFRSGDFEATKQARYEITMDILRELKLID